MKSRQEPNFYAKMLLLDQAQLMEGNGRVFVFQEKIESDKYVDIESGLEKRMVTLSRSIDAKKYVVKRIIFNGTIEDKIVETNLKNKPQIRQFKETWQQKWKATSLVVINSDYAITVQKVKINHVHT